MVMLKNELWLSIAQRRDILCVDCIEKRLGRQLTFDDLKECDITRYMMLGARIERNTR